MFFDASVRLTSLALELGSTPCFVAVFAIRHSLAPSLENLALEFPTRGAYVGRSYLRFFTTERCRLALSWQWEVCPRRLLHLGVLPCPE